MQPSGTEQICCSNQIGRKHQALDPRYGWPTQRSTLLPPESRLRHPSHPNKSPLLATSNLLMLPPMFPTHVHHRSYTFRLPHSIAGWKIHLAGDTIGALGHPNPICLLELADNFPMIPLLEWKNILRRGTMITISCSQAIFMARPNRQWTGPPYTQ
jgi:hypothetical protein